LDLAVTLDGYIEGPRGEIDWCIMDEEIQFEDFLSTIDTIFYGRVSYEQWGRYRPDEHASDLEKSYWKAINSKKKYVFTRSQRDFPSAEVIRGGIKIVNGRFKRNRVKLYGCLGEHPSLPHYYRKI